MVVIREGDTLLTFQIRKAKQGGETQARGLTAGGDCTGIQTQVLRHQYAQLQLPGSTRHPRCLNFPLRIIVLHRILCDNQRR